ncbi:GNAT family N-acetyltransferase [Streptomyces sp. DT24]|uniref:GNAT family N-acetyltransferase n=1 Tax=unclassified Streptomyces TaxID=2593676 RepID=UPI0023B89E07|nr:GNAT family N-acetyltransferase [Streptomyces sp. AM 4-1-1]WEH34070.1 GNAT family N-acetyltransferase [Streptomyces sp. AM 4-1-1]
MEHIASPVRIEPWSEGDLDLLRRANAPELMDHLGGPETEKQLVARHDRYVALSGDRTGRGRMYRMVLAGDGREAVGTVGFWERTWQGGLVYETGWAVLTPYQRRGIAVAATTAVIEEARAENKHRHLHAYPSVANDGSNGVCRKAGFTLLGECDLEYPPGTVLRTNNWRLDLLGGPGPGTAARP